MRIGIDMGGMSVKFGLVDRDNRIVEKKVIPTRLEIPAEEMIDDMVKAVRELLAEQGCEPSDCRGIGIGSPGTVDDETGVILYSNNFGWENVNIAGQMTNGTALPVCLANDADAAALGEVCAGAAKGAKSAVLLTLGTGVGGGVICNGEIFHGPLRGGLELGHMVIRAGGELCTCGRRGCLESYASATALMRMAAKAARQNPSSMMNEMCGGRLEKINGIIPFEAADKGDGTAIHVLEEYMDYLAEGIANVINIFRPELVIVGGGIAAQKERLTAPLQARVDELCFGKEHGQTARIVTSCLGNDAGIIGAAGLVSS
ncbi:MAG: ROK family protein [Clostridium sp.]|nr:ROK family protein [Clostridium sp.]